MPLDPTVILLIGAETAIADESQYARTLTAVGHAARTTAQFKYGVASITFDGAGDRVDAADSADFALGTGDFTIEGWFRFVTKTNSQAMVGQWNNAGTLTDCSWFLWITGGNLTFRYSNGAATVDLASAWVPTLGTWYHLAADRSGSTLRLYLDGAVRNSSGIFSSLIDSASAFTLGAIGTGGTFASFDFNGQMDEIRITKGLARYAGAFTPPTGPFPRPTATAETVQSFVWMPL